MSFFSFFLFILNITAIFCLNSLDSSSSLNLDCYLELDEYNLCIKRSVEWWGGEKTDKVYCCLQLELRNCLRALKPRCETIALNNEVTRSLRAKVQLMLATFPLLSERPCTRIKSLNQCYPSQWVSVLFFLMIFLTVSIVIIHICRRYNITISEIE